MPGSDELATASSAPGPGTSTGTGSSLAQRAAAIAQEELNELSTVRGVKILTKLPVPPHDDSRESRAGTYELTAMLWDELVYVLAPHPVTGVLVETEHFVRHLKGDLVQLSDREARRLLAGGAVVEVGVREEQEAEALRQQIAWAQAEVERMDARRQKLREVAERSDDPQELWQAGRNPDPEVPEALRQQPERARAKVEADRAEAQRQKLQATVESPAPEDAA